MGLYVGTAGNLVVRYRGQPQASPVSFLNVPAGTTLWGRFSHVMVASTAANILALRA